MTSSQIIGILAFVGQFLTLGLTVFAQVIPAEVAFWLHGVLAFIQAVTGRVQGNQGK